LPPSCITSGPSTLFSARGDEFAVVSVQELTFASRATASVTDLVLGVAAVGFVDSVGGRLRVFLLREWLGVLLANPALVPTKDSSSTV